MSMSDNRIMLREKKLDDLANLKSVAIAQLEDRGYEVRGKTTTQIRGIIKRRQARPPSKQSIR